MNRKGIVLFIVLATIFIVILLANIILSLVSSQSQLTHHQVKRIQAYYAGLGALNYTFDMLRKGSAGGGWPATPGNYSFCNSPGCTINDTTFPTYLIVNVEVRPMSSTTPPCPNSAALPGLQACIIATVSYNQ